MRIGAGAILLAILLGSAARAGADEGSDLHTRPTSIRGRLDGHVAKLTARYAISVEGPTNEQYRTFFELPRAGVVTGASVSERGTTRRLDLTRAAQVPGLWTSLTTRSATRARRWAVAIEHSHAAHVRLAIAVPRATTLIIELEISAPTCFHRDRRYAAVPAPWAGVLPDALRVPARHRAAVESACNFGDGPLVGFASHELARRRSGADRIGARAGRIALGSTQIAKLEVDLAARLTDLPRDLATVILIDASRSMSVDHLEAQRELVAGYLRAAPQGRVQLIAFARTARPLLPAWTIARHAAPRVDRELRALARRNGSNLDAALGEAAAWLATVRGTKRILMVTDEHLPNRLREPRAMTALVPAQALVNVVAIDSRPGLRERADGSILAPLAAATRGFAARVGPPEPAVPLDATFLARPITLDHARIRAPGWTVMPATSCPIEDAAEDDIVSLAEGTSCTWWGEIAAVTGPLALEGYLWGQRVTRIVRPDLGRATELARELTLSRSLDERLQARVDLAARAVNETWSLLVTWGGEGGYADLPIGGGIGFGTFGSSCCGHQVRHRFEGRIGVRDGDVASLVRGVVATCRPDHRVDVTVETTLEEIVEVAVQTPAAALRTCVEEALWNARLVMPAPSPHQITTLTIDPA